MSALYLSRNGTQIGVPAELVIFGPHNSGYRDGRYCLHFQFPGSRASAIDGRVFDCDHIMRPAVMDDFGTLVGVPE